MKNKFLATFAGVVLLAASIATQGRAPLTFVMPVSMGGAESQAKGRVQGNVNVGNGRDVPIAAVSRILPYIGYPRSLNAIAAINAVVSPSQENE